jgi:chromosome segregation protein
MHLKRLELIGFKSFANRTELEFVPGITAVVGPNGSGKSNISDAMRWVLGEQSAKSLRGSKMEDIIFAGSDSRKPVNFCEVSLTLDNSDHALKIDYSEVTITRRVYRSGDSEYFINKQSCRLKDIIELFMDTGVGKEAYSIIGQGRIEEILSTKSEDRRGIFEEAAGIVKYKARKRDAEKKLTETEANLTRISDILTELGAQMDHLQEQANKAKDYVAYKEELKQTEISLFIYLIEEINHSWNESKKQLVSNREEHAVLLAESSQMDAELSSWRWKMNDLDQKLENIQENLLKVSEETEKMEGKRELFRERKKNAKENYQVTIQKKNALETRGLELQTKLRGEQSQFVNLNQEYTEIQHQLKEFESQLARVTKDLLVDVEQLKTDYIELLNQIASAKNDLRHLEQTVSSSEQRESRLKEQQANLARHQKEISERKLLVQDELLKVSQMLEQYLNAYKQGAERIKSFQSNKEEYRLRLQKLEQKIGSNTSKRDVLVEMQADYSGFMHGVKEILKAREKGLQGIHGAVAELITVPKDLETAMEVALGGAMQHVVVENEAAARLAIQWLKREYAGRATFLPLDVIRSRKVTGTEEGRLQEIEGFIGVASDLIQSDEQYRKIVENLLGSVIVMKNLEHANLAARKSGYRYRFVTLDGDIVNPGGSMTGGTIQQKNANLLGRARQIEELEKEISVCNQEKEALIKRLKEMEDGWARLNQSQDELRQLGENARLKEQELKGRDEKIESEFRNCTDRLDVVVLDLAQVTEEKHAAQMRQNDLADSLGKWMNDEQSLKIKIEGMDAQRLELQADKEEYQSQITELRIRAAELKKQQEAVMGFIERTKQDLSVTQDEHQSAASYLDTLREILEGNGNFEGELEKEIADLRAKKEALGIQIGTLKKERISYLKQTEALEAELKDLRKQIKVAEDKLHKEELKTNRCEVELDNLLQKLEEEYELSYEAAKEAFSKASDAAETKNTVAALKNKIQALGTVNIGSIEEYERQEERFQFLTSQSNDLTDAKGTLYQVIAEIDAEMSKRFAETFEHIRVHFQQVFMHLFAGGRADLQLTDPDAMLSTGIEIVAQPPGKKLQNLALLSGGEKALTAIALLFAILRIKPVPFCVLDEVEAALDDANVYRFADYLREFSEQTQFICVTHRKGTMEGADVLYGVTMEESGVSKLVSVKLEEKEWMFETA